MTECSIGTTLEITDENTVLCGAIVDVTDHMANGVMVCQVKQFPDTPRFHSYQQNGPGCFHLGMFVYVRDGQYRIVSGEPNDTGTRH